MRQDLSAVVLAGMIEIMPVLASVLELAVAPIRRTIRAIRGPLDLRADIFQYRVRDDSTIVVVRQRRGARTCRDRHW